MSNFVKLIKEICKEQNIDVTGFSGDWAFLLKKDGTFRYIYGYQFGLDLASAASAVCKDKGIASDLMEHCNIPHVPHTCIMSPGHPEYLYGTNGHYKDLLALLKKHKRLVLKDNQGTGGDLVFVARNAKEMEYAATRIFAESGSMAVSPYVSIEEEIRCIMLDGELQVAFSKKRPALIGDGKSNVRELLTKKFQEDPSWADWVLSGANVHYDELHKDKNRKRLEYVPKKNEEYTLSWKHNLGQGAKAKLLYPYMEDEQRTTMPQEVVELATRVVNTFGLRFVSVDIVRVNGSYMVLEINNGVMMENLAGTNERDYRIAKQIYTKAILEMLK